MGCLKLRQKSWGSDSLFSYDITLLAGIRSLFLQTNLPLAASVLWFQTTEVSLTSVFKALCKNKLWGQTSGSGGRKIFLSVGHLFGKSESFCTLSCSPPTLVWLCMFSNSRKCECPIAHCLKRYFICLCSIGLGIFHGENKPCLSVTISLWCQQKPESPSGAELRGKLGSSGPWGPQSQAASSAQ